MFGTNQKRTPDHCNIARTIALRIATIMFCIFAAFPAYAMEAPVVTGRLVLPATEFEPGKSYPVLLELSIKEGYHINSNKPLEKGLIATKAVFTVDDEQTTIGRVTYPEAELKKFKFSENKLAIYEETVYIATSVSIDGAVGRELTLSATLDYQACTDIACMLPDRAVFSALLKTGTSGVPLEEELFAKHGAMVGAEDAGLSRMISARRARVRMNIKKQAQIHFRRETHSPFPGISH